MLLITAVSFLFTVVDMCTEGGSDKVNFGIAFYLPIELKL